MIKYNKLSRYKVERIFYYFFHDFTATQTALLIRINRNTINLWFQRFRDAIVHVSIADAEKHAGEL